jgi:hypothetical protein
MAEKKKTKKEALERITEINQEIHNRQVDKPKPFVSDLISEKAEMRAILRKKK